MAVATFTETKHIVFYVETCCNCGVQFAMTAEYRMRKLNDRSCFHCPNGHSQLYTGKTEAQKEKELREQAERVATARLAEIDRLKAEVKQTDLRRRAMKGKATRLQNRAKHGVCPCCSTTFKDLSEHMKAKHPDFAPSEVSE